MDSSKAYNKKSRQNVVDNTKTSRQQTVDSMQGKGKNFLSTVYRLLPTKKDFLSTVYCLLSTERGIALVIVLVLSAILLAVMAGLIYMVTVGTQISGMEKRYKTALEAGVGGTDVTYEMIAARGNPNIPNINFSFSSSFTSACMDDKLNRATSSTNWNDCTDYANATSLTIDPTVPASYDMTFQLGAAPFPTYTVYAKIVDTVEGNSGGDEGLLKGGVVTSNPGEVTVVSVPYLYTIEIDSQNAANPQERAKLSILYQY
jgi:hypothetical protein